MKAFTVVGLCLCGCEDSVCYTSRAKTPQDAAREVAGKRAKYGRGTKVVAVFHGDQMLPFPVEVRA